MSARPDRSQLQEITASFNREAGSAPDTLVKVGLSALHQALPNAALLRVLRVWEGRIQVWGSTQPDTVGDAVLDHTLIYQEAAQSNTSTHNAETDTHLIPMHTGTHRFCLLEIDHLDENEVEWLIPLIDHFAVALESSFLRDLIQKMADTALELTKCVSFKDIAATLAKTILHPGQYVSINLFEFDADGRVEKLRVIATANRKEAFDVDIALPVAPGTFEESFKDLVADKKMGVILDVNAWEEVDDRVREWLQSLDIASLYVMPLRSAQHMYGFVSLNDTNGLVDLLDAEKEAYTNLAEQTSAAIELQNLAKESMRVVRLNERQALALSELKARQDFPEMAQIIASHMLSSQEDRYVVITELMTDDSGAITDWQVVASANRERVFDTTDLTVLPWALLPDPIQESIRSGEPHVVRPAEYTDNPDEYGFSNVESVLNIPIVVEDRPTAILGIFSLIDTPFTHDEINAFSSLGDQMGALLQTHALLNETQKNEQIAAQLVEANHTISKATTYEEMFDAAFSVLPPEITFISIQLYDRAISPGEKPTSITMVASGTREGTTQSIEQKEIALRPGDDMPPIIQPLINGEIIIIQDIQRVQAQMTESMQALLRNNNVQGMAIAGLRIGTRLRGLLTLGGSEHLPVNNRDERNLRTISDQLAITIENRTLLQQTEESLDETARLFNISRTLQQAEDIADVMRMLFDYVDESVHAVNLVEFDYDAQDMLNSIVLKYNVNREGLHEPNEPVHKRLNAEQIAATNEYFVARENHLEFIEDTETELQLPVKSGIIPPGTRSSISIPIYNLGRLQQQINFTWNRPQRFDANKRRFFETVQSQLLVIMQNQQLLHDTQVSAAQLGSQVRVLRTLNQFTTALNSVQDEQTLLQQTCQAFITALNVDHVGIAMLNPGGRDAIIRSEYPEMGAVGTPISTDNRMIEELRANGRPIYISDIPNDPRLDDISRKAILSMNVKSVLLLPLRDLQHNLIGSVGLDFMSEKYQLSSNVIDIAQTILSQAATSLQKLRLLESTQRRTNQLQHINTFTQSIQATLDTEAIYQLLMGTAADMLPFDWLIATQFDSDNNHLAVVAQYDGKSMSVTPNSAVHVETENTVFGQSWETRTTLKIDDLPLETEGIRAFKPNMRSVMVAPILSRGQALGTVEICSQTPYMYNPTDLTVFQQLINQLAVALENTTAYAKSQKLAENKALASDISVQLQQQTDMQSLLEVTVNELGKVLNAKRGRIRLGTDEQVSENGVNDR